MNQVCLNCGHPITEVSRLGETMVTVRDNSIVAVRIGKCSHCGQECVWDEVYNFSHVENFIFVDTESEE
jgi:hypothetical protein